MSVSIREVARRAGVSPGTVSKVLNGSRESIGVAAQERIRRAASDLGYHPNVIARSLRRKRTDIIGFYSGHRNAWWLAEDIQRGCDVHQKDLLIHGSFRNDSVDELVAELTSGRIDGLLLVPALHDQLAERLASYNRRVAEGDGPTRQLPAVALADAAPGLPSIVMDDVTGGRMMADYLAERGHRRILYRNAYLPRTSIVRRTEAFLARAAERGLTVTQFPPAVYPPAYLTDDEIAALTTGPLSARPTAVATYGTETADPVLHTASRLGLHVPDDLAVIAGSGTGGVDSATLLRLTYVHTPWPLAALRAVDALMEIIEGKEADSETALPVELIVGDTA